MVDYIKTEEKLIKAEYKIKEDMRRAEFLSNVDKFIAKYDKEKKSEKLSVSMKKPEELSKFDKFNIPLRVRGKMLGVGRHKKKFYTEEDLKWSIEFHEDKNFPIKLDHRHKEASSTIGLIDKLYWNNDEKCVMYEGHINDETQARNVVDGAVTDVSATIFSKDEMHEMYGLIGKEPEYYEMSLVEDGSYNGNTIEPVLD